MSTKTGPRHDTHRGLIRHQHAAYGIEDDYIGRVDGPPVADARVITVQDLSSRGSDPLLERLQDYYGFCYVRKT